MPASNDLRFLLLRALLLLRQINAVAGHVPLLEQRRIHLRMSLRVRVNYVPPPPGALQPTISAEFRKIANFVQNDEFIRILKIL